MERYGPFGRGSWGGFWLTRDERRKARRRGRVRGPRTAPTRAV